MWIYLTSFILMLSCWAKIQKKKILFEKEKKKQIIQVR